MVIIQTTTGASQATASEPALTTPCAVNAIAPAIRANQATTLRVFNRSSAMGHTRISRSSVRWKRSLGG